MKKNNSKNIEVEVRAKLNDIDNFKNIIDRLGAKLISSVFIHDIYFCAKNKTKIKEVEMDEVGSYSLRLRRSKKNSKKEFFTLNTKTIISHGDHNAWKENEIEVNDFIETVEILNTTEFKPFFELEKERLVYILDDMEICVENIVDFGSAVEIEIMCSAGEENKNKQKIINFFKQCDIDKAKIVPKSITNIIMKERAFKRKISI